MTQGDDAQPGERRCVNCDRRWYSAALLSDEEATCPACGEQLESPSDD
ncbi:MAG TPA: hypothetical protein VEX39_16930 [Thermoleophilaceae bacterium]|nr:hypothetical protein [Thermoleophilaceae bacterium]